jgi:DNA-binding transcriptional LysR family regulator
MELPSGFDFRSIRTFIIVVDTGGMTQAAKQLSMTQSGVSQIISHLEEAIGAPLFDRSVRPMALTPAGAVLFDRGRKILAQTNEIFASIVQGSESNLPCLTIGMAESVANTVGFHLVKELRPLTRHWRIWAGISPDQNEALLDHAVDMIITTSNVLDPLDNLENHLILTEPFVMALPASYERLTGGFSQLKNFPLIRYSLRSAIGRQIEGQIKRLKLNLPLEIEFDTATSQIAAIAEGMGWGITTPMCLIQERVRLPQLRIEPLSRGAFSRSIKVVARAGSLGRIPKTVAATCSRILRQQSFPDLLAHYPWINDLLIWPEESGH